MPEKEYPPEIALRPMGRPIIDHTRKGELHRARCARYKARKKWDRDHMETKK